jgi:hypothetical protein
MRRYQSSKGINEEKIMNTIQAEAIRQHERQVEARRQAWLAAEERFERSASRGRYDTELSDKAEIAYRLYKMELGK